MESSSNKLPGAPLTGTFVRSVREPGRYGDGRGSHGLSLYVYRSKTGRVSKRWHQRLQVDGKVVMFSLGGWPAMPLAEARAGAFNNAVLRDREEPIPDLVRKDTPTFTDAVLSEIKRREPSWRNRAVVRRSWELSLLEGFEPLRDAPIHRIDTEHLRAILEPIWIEQPTKGSKMLSRVSAVFNHAINRGWLTANPAGQKLKQLLPVVNHRTKHFKPVHWKDLPATVRVIRDAEYGLPLLRLCTLWMILSASRTVNARMARWEQIDERDRLWTVPGAEMKNGREWRCPVTDPMRDILYRASETAGGYGIVLPESGWIFPGTTGKPFERSMPLKKLRAIGIDEDPHGFRSTFADWTAERTGAGRAVADAQLAHAKGDAVTEAYERTDLLDRRRELMAAYHEYALSG